MQVSAKVDYGLRAMLELAARSDRGVRLPGRGRLARLGAWERG